MTDAFRKIAYVQVIVGVVAYAVAEQSPAMVLVAGTLSTLSWYLVEGPNGRPLPRWFINLGVLIATGWLFLSQLPPPSKPLIVALGQFILCMQLFKLYERKENRDWAQLIVLSLMQMICASIISAEIVFGLLLLIYMVLTVYSILLFQLKIGEGRVQTAGAKQAPEGEVVGKPKPVVSRGHRRHFNTVALGCGAACVAISAMLFALLPRGHGAGMLGDWQTPTRRPVTGFDNKVQLDGGQRIATSRLPVMNVRLSVRGRDVGEYDGGFLLRGTALDSYDPRTRRWSRSAVVSRNDRTIGAVKANDARGGRLLDFPFDAPAVVQDITLRVETQGVLFSMYAPTWIEPPPSGVRFNAHDQVLLTQDARPDSKQPRIPIQYQVHSQMDPPEIRSAYERRWALQPWDFDWSTYARGPVVRNPRIRLLAEKVLAAADPKLQRDPQADSTADDHKIAGEIEVYLRENFSYTLDLPRIAEGADPIAAFLFEHRRGHCEFFASAMAALARSIGMRARVVNGFRATEFNSVGGYYVVRQMNAHAWCEVWQNDVGWRAFDPSPPAAIEEIHRPSIGVVAWFRDLYEYLEFQWINNVITYDDSHRRSVMVSIDTRLSALRHAFEAMQRSVIDWVRDFHARWLYGPLGYALILFVSGVIVAALTGLFAMWVSRRRAIHQLQLEVVTGGDQRRLARELRFYLRMLRIVEDAGYSKPLWQTPASFAEHLTRRDPHRFAPVVPLTDLFYEIRFGGRPLDRRRLSEIQQHLEQLRAGA